MLEEAGLISRSRCRYTRGHIALPQPCMRFWAVALAPVYSKLRVVTSVTKGTCCVNRLCGSSKIMTPINGSVKMSPCEKGENLVQPRDAAAIDGTVLCSLPSVSYRPIILLMKDRGVRTSRNRARDRHSLAPRVTRRTRSEERGRV